jgi:putative sigma-54 modulation protein
MTMIKIDSKEVTLEGQALAQVERCLHFALDRFQHAIREVEVAFRDSNGPKGGRDKECRVLLRLHPRGRIVVRTTHESCGEAANAAVEKVQRLVAKRLSKRIQGNVRRLRLLPRDGARNLGRSLEGMREF